MKILFKTFSLLVFASFLMASPRGSFAAAVKKANPAVVSIQSEKTVANEMNPFMNDPFFRHFFNDPRLQEPSQKIKGLGSGVIVSKEGYILTNYHVIKDSTNILVKLNDDRELKAKVIASDPPSDVGVIKIDASDLPVASLGNSDELEVGDIVLAIGNPFGVGQTVTQGIVSGLNRKNLGINLYEGFIQTDAAINPGNSGGALIDIEGNLIGINSAILTRSGGNNGIGFAIPINFAKQIMDELIKDGAVERGWLGIIMTDLTPELQEVFNYEGTGGVLVRAVYSQSPAAKSGLQPGDIITKINNTIIKDSNDVRQLISSFKNKQKIKLTAIRDSEEMNFSIVISIREKLE